jgi:hypothetical protein
MSVVGYGGAAARIGGTVVGGMVVFAVEVVDGILVVGRVT